ncbi:Uma2 family endonuclease [soil metagenome]
MVAEGVRTKRWTVEEIDRIVAMGLLDDPQHYELLDGDLIEKMPQNDPHWYGVSFTLQALLEVFGVGQPFVSQGPLKLGPIDAPEPDVAFFERNTPHMKGSEVLIVVEVGDSSLQGDLRRKARVYARHGIADYWVVDTIDRRLVVHRKPDPETEVYGDVRSYRSGDVISPLAASEHMIAIGDLLRQGEDRADVE